MHFANAGLLHKWVSGEGFKRHPFPRRPHPCFAAEKDQFSFTNFGPGSTLERSNSCLKNGEHLRTLMPSCFPNPFCCQDMSECHL